MSNNVKRMGIHSEEILKCGCMIKRYISGLNIIDNPQCDTHHDLKQYQCRSCNKFFNTHVALKKHRWGHAI